MVTSGIDYVLSHFSESNQKTIKLASKALLAAGVIAGLALGAFNMMSLGNAACAVAIAKSSTASGHELLQSWGKAGLLKGAAYGLGVATVIAPLHALHKHMFELSSDNETDSQHFLIEQILMSTVLVSTFSFLTRLDYVGYATRVRLLELKK